MYIYHAYCPHLWGTSIFCFNLQLEVVNRETVNGLKFAGFNPSVNPVIGFVPTK